MFLLSLLDGGLAFPSTKSLGSISPNRYISGIRHIIGSIQNYDLMQMQGLNSMLCHCGQLECTNCFVSLDLKRAVRNLERHPC